MPLDVRRIPQWVGYQLIPKDEPLPRPNKSQQTRKPDKVPKNPHTGRNASVTNPASWADAETAVAYANGHAPIAGVALVLTESLGLVVVDLDDCVHGGLIESFAYQVVQLLDSYTEYSQSGTGLHIFLNATMPGPRRVHRQRKVELYNDRRFITVTGQHLAHTPKQVMPRTDQLARLYAYLFPPPKPKTIPPTETLPEDDALWEALFEGGAGRQLQTLYEGRLDPCRGDHSLAVIQLGNALARVTNGNRAQMRRMLYQTKLVRPKWQEARGEVTWIDYQIADCIQYVQGIM